MSASCGRVRACVCARACACACARACVPGGVCRAREQAWTRERDKTEREVRYLKEAVSSLEQHDAAHKEALRVALARSR